MSINTVIFDFDGTIADTNRLIIDSWQHTYKNRFGHEEEEEKIIRSFGEPLAITMEKVFPDHDVDESISIYRGYQVNHFKDEIEAFPGMIEAMRELKVKGFNVGIVTSRMKNTTVQGLEKFGLMDYIDHIVSCEDTDKHKPDPAPVLLALEKFGISAEEAVMVGDSMFDIKCAHNAGVKAILIGWAVAVTDEEKNGPDGPDFVAEEAKDIVDIVAK